MGELTMKMERGAAVFTESGIYRNSTVSYTSDVYAVKRMSNDQGIQAICAICGTNGNGETPTAVAVTIRPEEYEAPDICLPCLRMLVAKAEELGDQGVI